MQAEMGVLLLSPTIQRKGDSPLVVALSWRWIMLVTNSQLWQEVTRSKLYSLGD